MSYDLKDLSFKHFADKITGLAEDNNVSAQTMIGACLMILRGLYACLPPEVKRDYAMNLHRFVNQLEQDNQTVVL